jgi:general secretion pathway protein A
MFQDYYGLREQPFGVTADPRFLYFTVSHREALSSLFYGIETGCGFLALIAPPGMGKTTLLAHLLDKLRSSAQTAFLFHTQCDSREFLSQLLMDLGVDTDDQSLPHMYESLHSVLLRNARTGRRVVLVIDEAQNLVDSVLETVRLLSDFETSESKLIQIVLCGQPQLADRLAEPGLLQLRQRISILSTLQPLTRTETAVYIDSRLLIAGHQGPPLFSYEAICQVASHSGGVPRNINNICFHALTLGCAKRRKQIETCVVREVLADLDLQMLTSQGQPQVTAGDSQALPGYDGVVPTDEASYCQFHAALRSAYGTNASAKIAQRSGSPDGRALHIALPSQVMHEDWAQKLTGVLGSSPSPPVSPSAMPEDDSRILVGRASQTQTKPVIAPFSDTASEKCDPESPLPDSQIDEQPSLSEVLATFFGPSLTGRPLRSLPPMPEGSSTVPLEAGD